ncbi:MAG: alpha-galactosidase [Promethearchaeota archaeon]
MLNDDWKSLPLIFDENEKSGQDWLIDDSFSRAMVKRTKNQGEIILTNGLIARKFKLEPECATIGYDNLMTGSALIRSIKPEAIVKLNGREHVIGGLVGLEEHAYLLPEWLENLKRDPAAEFHVTSFEVNSITERFPWKIKRRVTNPCWPPTGKEIKFQYENEKLPGIFVNVHYEIYDKIPLLSKWLTIKNQSSETLLLNSFTSEILAMVESSATPQGDPNKNAYLLPVHVESDYMFSAMSPSVANVTTVWTKDEEYTSQVAYNNDALVQLESKPSIGPEIKINPGDDFETFRTFELVFDSSDIERRTLAQRKMYRIIAPWVTENPIMFHFVNADPKKVKKLVDQCTEVGFEMVIISFGSGLNMEWADIPEYIEEYKELFDYAHSKGIEIGTYSLFSSRKISKEDDVIPPPGKKPVFGNAPCFGSKWGINYLRLIKKFMEETGCDLLEHDGPYPGDICVSTKHPGHEGESDSQWIQWKMQTSLYKWCRERGIYVNQPDWYFLSGGNKTGIGYKEVNWSLPRERQVILARQNIYDGTWEKTPSMGWLLTPLTVYHRVGDWKKSTLEPLSEHLDLFEAHLAQNFLSGVQSCYRGKQLYDTEDTKKVVKKWVVLYKKYRDILESDIIHLRRPDGRHVDGILHVNPKLENKGFAVLYNPLAKPVSEFIEIPLYYTGIEDLAIVSKEEGRERVYKLDKQYRIKVKVEIPARGRTWYLIR